MWYMTAELRVVCLKTLGSRHLNSLVSAVLPGSMHKLLEDARRCLAEGDLRGVLALCRPVLSRAPAEPDVAWLVGAALVGRGRAFQALSAIAPALESNPARADLQSLRSSCLLEGGRFQLARGSAEKALRLAPHNADLVAVIREADARIAELDHLIDSAARPLLTEREREALQRDFRSSYRSVPIIINSRDRVSCLARLVTWLRTAGYANVAILDNHSTYPPLLEYLSSLGDEIVVLRSTRNFGPRALWSSGLISLLSDIPFAYTDPDVVPVEDCPYDAVALLSELLEAHAHATKAGLGIRIDDIPDTYEGKSNVQSWESQFWQRPLPGNCYDAPVDTTFALYRPGSWHQLQAVRAGAPCLVRHLPWYVDSSQPTPEERYYAEHAVPDMSSWSGKAVSDMYRVQSQPQ
jgi:tetratricopeptide (TPR) repeat protein